MGAFPNNPGRSRGLERGGSTQLFAGVSFDRRTTWRTTRPAPFQRRGCGLPAPLLGGLWSLDHAGPISDAPPVVRGHVRVGVLHRPIRYGRRPPLSELVRADLTREPRALMRPAGESEAGQRPRSAFRCIEASRAETRESSMRRSVYECSAHPRTLLPSLHERQASDPATRFLRASPPHRHRVLRRAGDRGARCVRSTSATHATHVYPHLARSWHRSRLSSGGRPRVLGSPRA